jgi:hypothetical protein
MCGDDHVARCVRAEERVHSFRTLLNDLATLTRNTLVTAIAREQPFTLTARPTPIQQKARDLLGLSRTQ